MNWREILNCLLAITQVILGIALGVIKIILSLPIILPLLVIKLMADIRTYGRDD